MAVALSNADSISLNTIPSHVLLIVPTASSLQKRLRETFFFFIFFLLLPRRSGVIRYHRTRGLSR